MYTPTTKTYLGLRVELRAEERLALVAHALVRPVVDVRKQRLPALAQLGVVDRVAVVLGGDVALVRKSVYHRLREESSRENRRGEREGGRDGRTECVCVCLPSMLDGSMLYLPSMLEARFHVWHTGIYRMREHQRWFWSHRLF